MHASVAHPIDSPDSSSSLSLSVSAQCDAHHYCEYLPLYYYLYVQWIHLRRLRFFISCYATRERFVFLTECHSKWNATDNNAKQEWCITHKKWCTILLYNGMHAHLFLLKNHSFLFFHFIQNIPFHVFPRTILHFSLWIEFYKFFFWQFLSVCTFYFPPKKLHLMRKKLRNLHIT